jgi:hypothetical protein
MMIYGQSAQGGSGTRLSNIASVNHHAFKAVSQFDS